MGGEAAVDWQPTAALRLSGTAFYNRLEDAIGNVTIGFGPGNFEPVGVHPRRRCAATAAEYRCRYRTGRGTHRLVASGHAAPPAQQLSLDAAADRGASERTLRGRLLAQAPEHVITASAELNPTPKSSLTIQARYSGRQFEDDQNRIALAPFVVVDAAAAYQFSEQVSAALKIENIFDHTV
jgi:outer membrane receptor protein involved in Fe transport